MGTIRIAAARSQPTTVLLVVVNLAMRRPRFTILRVRVDLTRSYLRSDATVSSPDASARLRATASSSA